MTMNMDRTFFRPGGADLAIDLGTANTRVMVRGDGLVFDEPSLCCFNERTGRPQLLAAGENVRAMVDRTPDALRVVRPLSRGVLDNMDATGELLRYAVRKSLNRRPRRSLRAIMGVPADATQAERNALLTAAGDAGLSKVRLLAEPLAAALGAGLPVARPEGSMLVECGAGTTEVAILSLGDICLRRSVRLGGQALDGAIADHIHLKHHFLIGTTTAEQLKLDMVSHLEDEARPSTVSVKGRNLISGGPATIDIPLGEITGVINRHVARIVEVIRDTLNDSPPELARDIHENGIVLTGGSATLALLRREVIASTGLQVYVAEQPLQCVARGLGSLLRE
jgi:rod shape-determining protein MreB